MCRIFLRLQKLFYEKAELFILSVLAIFLFQFECLSVIGSNFPSRIEGNIFCDKYHAATGTYCKRLKVLCPEHFKQPKVTVLLVDYNLPNLFSFHNVSYPFLMFQTSLEEVCGCPIQDKQFRDTGDVCRNPKRKCNKHPCWERMRRAEIDLERLRQVFKRSQ